MRSEENAYHDMVRLLDPTLCLSCRFASIALVEREDHSVIQMVRCKRLDCDNWQVDRAEEDLLDLKTLHLLE
jgi:hypothetical protein